MPESLLRLREVIARVGLSRSSIYLAISQDRFPRPALIGLRAVAWRSSEIENWIASRVVASPEQSR